MPLFLRCLIFRFREGLGLVDDCLKCFQERNATGWDRLKAYELVVCDAGCEVHVCCVDFEKCKFFVIVVHFPEPLEKCISDICFCGEKVDCFVFLSEHLGSLTDFR